jgi:hypothetical protein
MSQATASCLLFSLFFSLLPGKKRDSQQQKEQSDSVYHTKRFVTSHGAEPLRET